MTFAVITPALVIGAYVERMNFAAVLLFSLIWLLAVYAGHALGLGWRILAGGMWILQAVSLFTLRARPHWSSPSSLVARCLPAFGTTTLVGADHDRGVDALDWLVRL